MNLYVAVRRDPSIRHFLMQIDSLPSVMRLDTEPGEGELVLIHCSSVHETGYGFLKIIPRRDGKEKPGEGMDMFALPPGVIAWIAEARSEFVV